MATLRFDKLKSKKKQLIIDSIQACLEKYDIDSLSIKDIADEAEISRGTFYTYFLDIKDCMFSLIVHYMNTFIENLKIATINNNGNFLKTVKEQYYLVMDYLQEPNRLTIIKNISHMINLKMIVDYFQDINEYSSNIYHFVSTETDIGKIIKQKHKIFAFLVLLNSVFVTAMIELSINVDRKIIDKETNYKFELLEKSLKM